MIRHTQTIFVDDPRGIPGDCLRTAVASLLDLPTEAVPHFVLFDTPGEWFTVFTMWLAGRGLRIHPMRAEGVDRECLAFGMSPRDVEHVVVWGPGGLIHDPHPSRAGVEPRQFWALVPAVPVQVDPPQLEHEPGDSSAVETVLPTEPAGIACAVKHGPAGCPGYPHPTGPADSGDQS